MSTTLTRGLCVAAVVTAPLAVSNSVHADDALTIYSAGLDSMLVSEKDAGLREALRLLDDRILDLPAELGEEEFPAGIVNFVLELLASPMCLRAGIDMEADPMMGPPFYAQLDFMEGGERFSKKFDSMVAPFLPGGAAQTDEFPGLMKTDMEGIPMYFGQRDEDTFVLGVNGVLDAPQAPTNTGLPDGIDPVFVLDLNMHAAQPAIEMFLAQTPPDMGNMMREQWKMFGLIGEDASRIYVSAGYGEDRSHAFMRYTNYRQILEHLGSMPDSFMTAADLRLVPADATFAQINKADLSHTGEMLRHFMQMGMDAAMAEHGHMHDDDDMHNDMGDDPFAMAEAMFGVNPDTDFFAHLGDTYGYYMSDTTGGGGLTSLVAFFEVTDAHAMGESLTKLENTANNLAHAHARGYVRLRTRQIDDGLRFSTLTFPGLPIPLEVSYAIADNYLFLALSPNGLHGAIDQMRTGRTSLAQNPRFKAMGGNKAKGAMQVMFFDTPRLVGNGYWLVNLGSSAVCNALRCPSDPDRQPPQIMPPYAELVKDCKAEVMITRIEGDDLIMTDQSDPSILVNLCGIVGTIGGAAPMLAIGGLSAAIQLPAIAKAREKVKAAQSASNTMQILVACMDYVSVNNGTCPTDLQQLVQYIGGDSALYSPFDDHFGGEPDYWLNANVGQLADVHAPDRLVFVYDKAMLRRADHPKDVVVVGFADGHIEQVPLAEMYDLVNEAPNDQLGINMP